ncbi:hypothetical protein T265_15543, partial [Opisthorchis viverrini]
MGGFARNFNGSYIQDLETSKHENVHQKAYPHAQFLGALKQLRCVVRDFRPGDGNAIASSHPELHESVPLQLCTERLDNIPSKMTQAPCYAKPVVVPVIIKECPVDRRSRKRRAPQQLMAKPTVKYDRGAYDAQPGRQPVKQSLCSRMLSLTMQKAPYPDKDVHVQRYRPLNAARHAVHTDSDRVYHSLKTSAF